MYPHSDPRAATAVSVASTFLASMEWCSYIHLHTTDDDGDEDPQETKDRPLMLSCPYALTEYYHDRFESSTSFANFLRSALCSPSSHFFRNLV